MSAVEMGRALFGITLGFHAIFATLGVGIPLLISLAELIGIVRQDSDYILLARRWTKGFVVLVAVGVVTGTIVGFNLSLLWPQFMKEFAPVIALPFLMEVFAFFMEAVFMALYVYAWDKFSKPIYHWLCSLPVIVGAGASGMLITTANAFMNTPVGFRMMNGHVTDVHPIAAMFSPATPTETLHVLMSAYLTAAFVIAAIPAWQLLRGKRYPYYKKGLQVAMWVALVSGVLTPIIGDAAGKFLAKYQPEKLAAGEALFHTQTGAPLVIGGIIQANAERVVGGISIPHMLSFLATSHFNSTVLGLDAFPKNTWPPLVIHYFFDAMVGIGSLLMVVALVFFAAQFRRFRFLTRGRTVRLLYAAIFICGPLSVLAMECGWMYDEIGRQPWIVEGIMLVKTAFTRSLYIAPVFITFVSLYVVLGFTTVWILRSYFRRHPLESDVHWSGVQE